MTMAEISKMSASERLQTMEHLWSAICQDTVKPESPEWHRETLEQRRKRMQTGEAKFYSLDEVKTHFS